MNRHAVTIITVLAVASGPSALLTMPAAAGAAGANDLSALCSATDNLGLTHGGCVSPFRSYGYPDYRTSADLSASCKVDFGGVFENEGACVSLLNEVFKGTGNGA